MGTILRVNLSAEEIKYEKLPDENTLRKFIGGRGLGVKILFDELKPGVDPLSSKNKIIFASGPVTGTIVPTSGRHSVVFKSPLTCGIFDSCSGGRFGAFMKFAGTDAIIFEGTASSPVYLYLENKEAKLLDAKDLWGLTVSQTTDVLEARHGKDVSIACIGPAGENKALISAIINERSRAAGRGGGGAVLGSKKLKAIVVKGRYRPKVADEGRLKVAVRMALDLIKENPITAEGLPKYGTSILVHAINTHGIFPIKNFQANYWPWKKAEAISGERIHEEFLAGRKSCFGCPIGCGRVTKIKTETYTGLVEGPEYEVVWSMGAQCNNTNLESIIALHHLCNEFGLDGISMGSTIGCAMELFEKGLIKVEDIGYELKWGDYNAMLSLVKDTAYAKGFGQDLGLGSKRLAEKYGCPEVAMQSKGLEMPAYDPRGAQGMGLAYATSNRGACHLRAYMIGLEVFGKPRRLLDRYSTKDKAVWTKDLQDTSAAVDTLVLCRFSQFALGTELYAEFLSAVTGWEIDLVDFLTIGERIYNLERLFNVREGFSAKDDALPKRLLVTPSPSGPSKGRIVRLEEMLNEYYTLRGWDKEGKPTESKIRELGLMLEAIELKVT